MNSGQNNQNFSAPEFVSGNPIINNIKDTGCQKVFLFASAVYIALPLIQFVAASMSSNPIQLLGAVAMMMIVASCNSSRYPGVRTSGFTVLKAYSIVMVVAGGIVAASALYLLLSAGSLAQDEAYSEMIVPLIEELNGIVGFEVDPSVLFGVVLAEAALMVLRYAFVIVMCSRLVNSLRYGRNCGKIPVIIAVIYIIMALSDVAMIIRSVGVADTYSLIIVILETASYVCFSLVIFKYNNSLEKIL